MARPPAPGTNTADTNLVLQPAVPEPAPALLLSAGRPTGPPRNAGTTWAATWSPSTTPTNRTGCTTPLPITPAPTEPVARLNDEATAGVFVWTTGRHAYANWLTGQPALAMVILYAMLAQPMATGLWTLATTTGFLRRRRFAGPAAVELDAIPPTGAALVSVTNSPPRRRILSSNGCLYANLVDITNGFHEIWSAPGLLQSNVYQHVA